MDESWRMTMGISGPNSGIQPPELEPEDFDDVYGGPPRSVLSRKHSADFTNAEWFYRDIFRQPQILPENLSGRKLPEFVIPARRRESKSNGKGKCMLKSKSTSSSGWSLEDSEFNPKLGMDREDVALSSFTSRLRPINVSSKWCSSSKSTTKNKKKDELPPFGSLSTKGPYNIKDTYDVSYDCNPYISKDFNYENPQLTSSLKALNLGPPSTPGLSVADEYHMLHLESPSSGVSSYRRKATGFDSGHEVICMNSWTPEVNVVNSEAVHDINEAIAWAKEKFQG